MATTATRPRALELYRALLRCGRSFNDYNVREYVKRRATESFRANAALADVDAIESALEEGARELDVARRQATVYALYGGRGNRARWTCGESRRGGARGG